MLKGRNRNLPFFVSAKNGTTWRFQPGTHRKFIAGCGDITREKGKLLAMAFVSQAMSSHVTCVLNGSAGSNHVAEAREHLTRLFAGNGSQARILLAQSRADITACACRGVQENSQPVVAGGGDGTVNAVAAALVGTETSLAILPLGTWNHFAKDLRIPLDLEGAARNIVTGRVATVDVGEVNGHIFLNNSGLGIYPRIVRQREQQQSRGHSKWVAFAQAVVSVLSSYSLLQVRLRVDGEDELARDTPFVFVGNNRYEIEGSDIGERKRLDAGQLCVYMAHRAGRGNLLRLALDALFGRLKANDLDALDAKEIRVQARKQLLNVATDGEVELMNTPLHYRIRPRALRVIVPVEEDQASAA
ncbi:MAG: diacylglycerol kinase family protein [Candidatus Acidiferrales bacterium]